jgi:diketogulonate reductase-like aldo/keto reductase
MRMVFSQTAWLMAVHSSTFALVASADSMTVILNNGLVMPKVAFAANVWDPDTCKYATLAALSSGFRFVWSSVLIGNSCQAAQAQAIAAARNDSGGIPRQELFVSGTVNTGSCGGYDDCVAQTRSGAENQFQVLGEPLEMLMLDYPSRSGCDAIRGQWKVLSDLYQAKRVKSIAVSNFGSDELDCLKNTTVAPASNQLLACVSCGDPVPIVQQNAAAGGVVVQAYSPLGSGSLVNDPLLISIGGAHNKSAAQVALRWLLQHNVTIATQSTNPTYLAEDLDIFDFVLAASEMAQLDADHRRRQLR